MVTILHVDNFGYKQRELTYLNICLLYPSRCVYETVDVLGVLLQVLQGEHFVFEVRDNASLDGIGVG